MKIAFGTFNQIIIFKKLAGMLNTFSCFFFFFFPSVPADVQDWCSNNKADLPSTPPNEYFRIIRLQRYIRGICLQDIWPQRVPR